MSKKKSAERFSVWQIKLSEKNLTIIFIIICVIFSNKLRKIENLATVGRGYYGTTTFHPRYDSLEWSI